MKIHVAFNQKLARRLLDGSVLAAGVLVMLAGGAEAAIGDKLPTAKLLYVRDSNIMYSTVKNWNPQVVTSGSRPRWKSDGTKIVYGSGSGVWVMNSDFSGKTQVVSNGSISDWVPGENAITFIASDAYRVRKYNLTTGATTTIYDARDSGWHGQKVSQAAELRTGGRFLLLFRVTNPVGWPGTDHQTEIADLQQRKYISNAKMRAGDCSPAWAPDGSYLLQTRRSGDRPVYRTDFNAGSASVSSAYYFMGLASGSGYYIHTQRVSNDGKWLTAGIIKSGNRDLYLWEIGTPESTQVRMTTSSAVEWQGSLYIPTTPPDSTPPSTPGNLAATTVSTSQIDLTWSAATDAESGVSSYNIYRGGVKVDTSSTTSYSDTGLTEGTSYTYQVSAVNGAGLEGSKSGSVTKSTLSDATAPTIASVLASGNDTRVIVTFSEPVEQASAETLANYAIDNGITVSAASLGGNLKTVTLTTSTLSESVNYTVTINGVKDRASTPNTIAANSTAAFTFVSDIVNGLVAHWKLDDGSGTTAVDSSVSGNDATVSGAVWVAGQIGGALQYANGDSVVAGTPVNLGADWTISVWFTAPLPNTGESWHTMTRAQGDDHQVIVQSSTMELGTYLNSGGSFHSTGFKIDVLSAGWHHMAAVGSGTTTAFYIDGALVGTAGGKSTTEVYGFGAHHNGSQRFTDSIDDMRIYDRALSAAEVVVLYGVTPPTNQAPIVNPGVNQTITQPASATLAGTVTDDGLPSGALTSTWTQVSGPGTASFTDASAPATDVSFSLDGTYVLDLTADDGALSSSAQVTIIVQPQILDTITVTAPNGGEVMTAGQTFNVTWDVTGGVTDSTLRLSLDGGNTWTDIEQGVDTNDPRWLNYPWTVPAVNSTSCLIMVEDYFGNIQDVSDSPFTIQSTPDTNAPVITLSELYVEGEMDDPTILSVTVDGALVPVASLMFGHAVPITTLSKGFTVNAQDAGGNIIARTINVLVQ